MLATMQQELDREMGILGKADPPAYFLGYTVTDSNHATVTGSNGALLSSNLEHTRWLEAQVPFVELSDKVRSNPLDYSL